MTRIQQSHGNHEGAARKTATTIYMQMVRQVLRSQLDGKNKIWAINTYALLIISYSAGIISWPEEEIEASDIKARNVLTMRGRFRPSPAP